MKGGFPKAEELCKIIGACREAGVSAFKCGPVEILFGGFTRTSSWQEIKSGAAPTPAAEDPEKTIQAEKQEEASLEEQGVQERERQVDELLITDPLLAEELMENGELEKGSTDGSGEAFDQ